MANTKTIIVYGHEEEWYETPASTINMAIADLYDYTEGEIPCEAFRKICGILSAGDVIKVFNSIAFDEPIVKIFTNCEESYTK